MIQSEMEINSSTPSPVDNMDWSDAHPASGGYHASSSSSSSSSSHSCISNQPELNNVMEHRKSTSKRRIIQSRRHHSAKIEAEQYKNMQNVFEFNSPPAKSASDEVPSCSRAEASAEPASDEVPSCSRAEPSAEPASDEVPSCSQAAPSAEPASDEVPSCSQAAPPEPISSLLRAQQAENQVTGSQKSAKRLRKSLQDVNVIVQAEVDVPEPSLDERLAQSSSSEKEPSDSDEDEMEADDEIEYPKPEFDPAIRVIEYRGIFNLEFDTKKEDDYTIGCEARSRLHCYDCDGCVSHETIFHHIRTHVSEAQNDNVGITQKNICLHCMRVVPSGVDAENHRRQMAKLGRFQTWLEFEAELVCIFCKDYRAFPRKSAYFEHIFKKHYKRTDMCFVCQLCGFRTNNEYELQLHFEKHGATYCQYCHMVFAPLPSNLPDEGFGSDEYVFHFIYEHIMEHFLVQDCYSCDKCRLTFLSSESLDDHSLFHDDEMIFTPNKIVVDHTIGNPRNSFEFKELKDIFAKIRRSLLTKAQKAKCLSSSKPEKPVIIESSAESCDTLTNYYYASDASMEYKDFKKWLNPSDKSFLDLSDCYVHQDMIEALAEMEGASFWNKKLFCCECGHHVLSKQHFYSKRRVCGKDGCQYVSSCVFALSIHVNHGKHGTTFEVPSNRSRNTTSLVKMLPEAEQDFQNAMDLDNEKILICHACNAIFSNLVDTLIHTRTTGHLVLHLDKDEEEEEEEGPSN